MVTTQSNVVWASNDPDAGTGSASKPTMSKYGFNETKGAVTDNDGNVYVVGNYTKKVTSSITNNAVYIYKFDPNGNILWETDLYIQDRDLFVAGSGIVIGVDGIFVLAKQGRNTIDNTSIRYTLPSTGVSAPFATSGPKVKAIIAKLDFDGTKISMEGISTKAFPLAEGSQLEPTDIAISRDGSSIYVTGSFLGELYVRSHTSSPNNNKGCNRVHSNMCGSCCGASGSDIFLLKFTNELYNDWMKSFDFKESAFDPVLEVENGRVYLGGTFGGSKNTLLAVHDSYITGAYSCPIDYSLPSSCSITGGSSLIKHDSYNKSAFLLKLDTAGYVIWKKCVNSSMSNQGDIFMKGLSVKNGEIYVSLQNYGSVELFYGTSNRHFTNTESNIILAKVKDESSLNFNIHWAQIIEVPRFYLYGVPDAPNSVYIDSENNIHVLAFFYSYGQNRLQSYATAFNSIYAAPSQVLNLAHGVGGRDIVHMKYSSEGDLLWGVILGSNEDDIASVIVDDRKNNLFLGGEASLTIDLDPTNAIYNLTGPTDFGADNRTFGFIAKYGCIPVKLEAARDTFCEGEITRVNATNTCNGCNYTYTWQNIVGGVNIVSSSSKYDFTGNLGANQIIVSSEEADSECITSDTLDIVVNPKVNVIASPISTNICEGDSASFVAVSSPAIPVNYSWYGADDTFLLSSRASFEASNSGVYTVFAESNGCISSFNVNLNYYPDVSPRIVPDSPSLCGGGAYLEVLDCPGCQYVWTPPSASSSNSIANNITADISGSYGVEVQDIYGCSQILSINVQTAPFLVPPIIPKTAVGINATALCNGEPITLSTIPYGTGVNECATCSYLWSDGSTGPYTFASSPGVYNVTVTNLLTGCIGVSQTLNIKDNTFSTPLVSGAPYSVCNDAPFVGNNPAVLQVDNPCTNCTYTWYNNANNLQGSSTNVESPTSIATNVSDTGEYYVVQRDTFGCLEKSEIFQIGYDTSSKPPIYSSAIALCGTTNTANLTTVNCNDCDYQWYFNSAIIPGATSYSHTSDVPGRYQVEVTYANSCPRKSDVFDLVSATFNPRLNVSDTIYSCNENEVILSVNTLGAKLPPFWKYQWYYNTSQPIPNATGLIHKTSIPGDYSLQVVNGDGCIATTPSVTVAVTTEGSNPRINSSAPYLCETLLSSSVKLNLTHENCDTCFYTWYYGNTTQASNTSMIDVSNPGVYYATVRDVNSGCEYSTPVFELKDSIPETPSVSAVTNNLCSTSPVVLSTSSCVSCKYNWYFQGSGSSTFSLVESASLQNTYSADTTGNFKVEIIDALGCVSPQSNSIPVTRLPFNAQLTGNSGVSICNGFTKTIFMFPDILTCPDCEYTWFRDSLAINVPNNQDFLNITVGGNYYAIVDQTYPLFSTTPYTFGCTDTTEVISFMDVSLSANLQSSALAVCGSNGQVTLSVDSCDGCSYAWYFDGDTSTGGGGFNYNILGGETDTFYVVNGTAAKGMYKVEVGLNGCFVQDSTYIFDTTALVFNFDTSTTPYSNICNGASVTMSSNCARCSDYQWYEGGFSIPGAIGASYEASSAGNYQLFVNDAIGCTANSPLTNVTEVNPPAGFELLLDSISVIPLSYGDLGLEQYLNPVSVYGLGTFLSIPQPAAVVQDSFYPISAGSGSHLVTYSYNYQNCVFSTSDTIEVLSQMDLTVINFNSLAPQYEACLNDNLKFTLTNFIFKPNQILFPTSSTTYDTIDVSSTGLSAFAGVFSGDINVTVPLGAITGKVILRDSTSGETFQSQFFLVVQNPSVAISLGGVPQPLCSADDTIVLTGFPQPGIFKAAYVDSPTVHVSSLIRDSTFLVENVTYTPNDRIRNLELTYVYTPEYSNGLASCPNSVVAILPVQVNNNELDSVEFSPISATEVNVPMSDLTRLIYPVANRDFPATYTGTYITGGNLLANTIPFISASSNAVTEPVVFEFSNQTCTDTLTKSLEIWNAPVTLDSIPEWICRNASTIFIGRDASGMYVETNGNRRVLDINYRYQSNIGVTDGLYYTYDEFINKMGLSSSNGGLYQLSSVRGQERYAFIPDSVTGSSTRLTLRFEYERSHFYFLPTTSTSNYTKTYTIASTSKVVNIEEPITAQINPAILADTIFCQDNQTEQFSGIPAGGQYYIDDSILISNLFNPDQVVSRFSARTGAFALDYVVIGNACSDTASARIYIPEKFTVTITQTDTTYCRLDDPDTISVSSSIPGVLDTNAGVFFVNESTSGRIFNPATAPAILNSNLVVYLARDTFGCTASDTTQFIVHPMPSIRMDTIDPEYCLNDMPFNLDLYEDTIRTTTWHLQSSGYLSGIQVNLLGKGVVPSGNNPIAPVYSPAQAGVGLDTISYTYTDVATGCSTTLVQITKIKALPDLTLFTDNNEPLDSVYCERDTLPIYATPVGGTFFSDFVTSNGTSSFDTSLTPPMFNPWIAGPSPSSTTEVLAYTYMDPTTMCRDTIRDTVLIKNITVELKIANLMTQVCADDTIYNLDTLLRAGTPSSGNPTAGVWGTLNAIDSNVIVNDTSGYFNPYLSGVFDAGRDVIISYTYNSNGCPNLLLDTVRLNPLPQLSYNLPGDTLFNSTDSVFHICFSGAKVSMQAYNQYQGTRTAIIQTLGSPPRIDSSGFFGTLSGPGMVYDTLYGNWNYHPPQAQHGLDSIYFTYEDARGCINTHYEPLFVDTVPPLGFAGFDPSLLDTLTNRFVYCENSPSSLIIPSPFGGATYWNYDTIPSILFELKPDTLVDSGQTTIHRLTYEFISARYQNGGVCIDSTIQFVEVRPTPTLALSSSVPSEYCVADSTERIVLAGIPAGGAFQDVTRGVIAGIVSDSLFVPMAQMGTREVIYYYTDTATGCTDTLTQFINVYNLPEVSFETGGGCEGDSVFFVPNDLGLSNTGTAIDSITLAIWDYGDGQIDSVDGTMLPSPISVGRQPHIYSATGVYYPTLTVFNHGSCDTTFMRRIIVSPKYVVAETTPYLQDFEDGTANWFQENGDSSVFLPTDSLWEWGMATGFNIETAIASNNVWATKLAGPYPQGQMAWVYSPCFDISTLSRPMVALDIWRDSREPTDGAVLQYFDEPSSSWKILGIRGKGLNWYNPDYVISAPGYQIGAPLGWSNSSDGWEDARYRLDVSGGDLRFRDNIRFRVAFASTSNSVIGGREGFAFDNFYIGNRKRSVLVEHFSNQNYPDIKSIETNLYNTIYSNLYGRDVSLIQYHIHSDGLGQDYLMDHAFAGNSSRESYYGIPDANKVRINGDNSAGTTDNLVNSATELLDQQMLKDAMYKIERAVINIRRTPNLTIQANANVIPIGDDIVPGDYRIFTVITEDSILSIQNHKMVGVLRKMLPDPAGSIMNNNPVAYADTFYVDQIWDHSDMSDPALYDPTKLQATFFVQNYDTKEVEQVVSTRNINIFDGPVAVEDLEDKDGLELLSIKLYPNPTENHFFVEFSQQLQSDYTWQVVDVTGRILRSGVATPGTKQMKIATEDFSSGMYIFVMQNENVRVQRKVIIAK